MDYTPRLRLQLPPLDTAGWNDTTNANWSAVDATFLGPFAVVPTEVPSSTRNFIVRGGAYVTAAGPIATVADFPVQTAAASSDTYIYLKSDGTLGTGAAWPVAGAGSYAPLAIVTAGASAITAIVDARHPLTLIGS